MAKSFYILREFNADRTLAMNEILKACSGGTVFRYAWNIYAEMFTGRPAENLFWSGYFWEKIEKITDSPVSEFSAKFKTTIKELCENINLEIATSGRKASGILICDELAARMQMEKVEPRIFLVEPTIKNGIDGFYQIIFDEMKK